MEKDKILKCFPPIINKNSKVLILGTMPSIRSFQKGQYYGHPQNHFWRIIYGLFGQDLIDDYDERVAFLLKHHIALWDVLAACQREGSSDSKIKNPVPNDIAGLLCDYPAIRAIFCDSVKAEELFNRFIKDRLDRPISFHRLPSPSPARAMRWEDKLDQWRIILPYLD